MTSMTVPPPAVRKYGFDIYKDGKLVREEVIETNDPALAEARVYGCLSDGEYPWYAVPRLIEEGAVVMDLPVETQEKPEDIEGEVAA